MDIRKWSLRLGIASALFLSCGQDYSKTHTGDYIIFAADGVESKDVIIRHGLDPEMNLDSLNIAQVHTDLDTLDQLVQAGELEGYVPFGNATPRRRMFNQHIRIVENDSQPVYSRTARWANRATRAQALETNNLTGEGIRIGIIDSGINPRVADYQVEAHYNFVDGSQDLHDEIGHGTIVTGIIHRLLPDAQIYSYVAYRRHNGRLMSFVRDIVESIDQAIADDVHVINMSLSLDSPAECEGMEWQDANRLLGEALERAASQGIFLVTSSANNRADEPLSPNWLPEGSPYVLSVGAYDRHGEVARFSDLDAHIFAPGVHVYSFTRRGRHVYGGGTSVAAPQVTIALAAILEHEREAGRTITRQEAYDAITETGRQASSIVIGTRGRRTYNFRMLDYRRMIRRLQRR